MKIYEIITVKWYTESTGEEYLEWRGFDHEEALKQKRKAESMHDSYLTESEKKHSCVEARIYDIPDDTDVSDEDALTSAMIDCCGYDTF